MKRRKCYIVINKKEPKLHQDTIKCYNCGKEFLKKLDNDKNYQKVRDHCYFTDKYRGAAHSMCNLRFNVPKEIPVVFQSGSN